MQIWTEVNRMDFIIRGQDVHTVIDRITKRKYYWIQKINKNYPYKNAHYDGISVKIIPGPASNLDLNYNYYLCNGTYDYLKDYKEKCIPYNQVHKRNHSIDGYYIKAIKAEIHEMAKGGILICNGSYMFGCAKNQEPSVNENFIERKLRFRLKKDFYFMDDFVRISLFLRGLPPNGRNFKEITPLDVRKLDVNSKLLDSMMCITQMYYEDAITVKYEAETEQIAAQYFVTRFDSNREWKANPVNDVNFRVDAFLLPECVSMSENELPPEKIARNMETEEAYYIDSIHMNSDISEDMNQACEWICNMYTVAEWA